MRIATYSAALALAATTAAFSQVQLNEIRTDEQSTDTNEYVEFMGAPGASLDGLTLIVIGDQGSGATKSGFVEFRWTFGPDDALGASGLPILRKTNMNTAVAMPFFEPSIVIAPDVASGVFENSDNVAYMLVSGYTGANPQGNVIAGGEGLDTNDDGVLDITPWASVLDSVALKITNGDAPDTVGTDVREWWYGPTTVGPNPNRSINGTTGEVQVFWNSVAHAYRDGATDAWHYGPFNTSTGINVDTPGAPNFVTPIASCGDASAGDCMANHEYPTCADQCCCDYVCAADPYCCEYHWDAICVTKAGECAGGVHGRRRVPRRPRPGRQCGRLGLGCIARRVGTGDYDLDGDGVVGGSDLGALVGSWGPSPKQATARMHEPLEGPALRRAFFHGAAPLGNASIC